MESGQTGDSPSGLTWKTFGFAVALHAALFLVILAIGLLNRTKKPDGPKENIVPIDLTVVPPWAQKTDDPNPDPNPPPPKVKKQPPKSPPKPQEVKKPVDLKDKNALVKVAEQKKPEMKRGDLKKDKQIKKAKPQKIEKPAPPKPAPEVERPPDLKIPDAVKTFGKGTAAEDPLKDIDMKKMLEQGYRYGARNQLATSEEQLCVSLIAKAIRREWEKESFNWHSGLKPIQLKLQLGAGGKVLAFSVQSSSGDGDVDRTARNALTRLKGQVIYGLTANFISKCPNGIVDTVMEPTSGR